MFTLTIETTGAAFGGGAGPAEVRRLLQRFIDGPAFSPAEDVRIFDSNGNTVGRWSYTDDHEHAFEGIDRGHGATCWCGVAEDDERGACILTGADGEDVEDCTTHGHEEEPEFDEDARRAAYALGGEYMHTGGTL